IWSKNLPNVNIKAEVTAGSVTNLIQVAKLESEVGFAQGDAAAAAVSGTGRFPGPLPIVMLGKLYPNLVHLVTLRSSGIRSVGDLRGRRVSVGPPGSGNAVTAWNILHALGMTERDFHVRQLNYTETSNALKDGTLDAGFIAGGIGIAAVVELAISRKIRLVAFSDEEMKKVTTRHAAYSRFVVPPGVYKGVEEPVQAPTLWNLLIVNEQMDANLAYRLVKTLFEHRDELEKVSKVATYITPESARDTGGLPLHPGAKRYYDEVLGSR
ncbi:MAG: TAXI family TRAP transporter solute-binding subunit, partial [Acidobacteriota bacterium]